MSVARGNEPLLSIRDLCVEFHTAEGVVHAVNHVDYDVWPGEFLGVVGESGCGKTVTALTVLRLLEQPPARVVAGEIRFDGRDLLRLHARALRSIRGSSISMIFQDPQSSLNPVLTVGRQVVDVLRAHDRTLSPRAAHRRAVELLEMVGVPDAAARSRDYPFQWSGGMCQRAMIAMAIANRPKLLIADEPTTALDVTIQAQVLDVLRLAQEETGAATVLITHDLGVVAEIADRVVVMYAGRVVEQGDARDIFHRPRHPYTVGLLQSLPRLDADDDVLDPIPGRPPNLTKVPSGCPFHPRCRLGQGRARCADDVPALRPVDGDVGPIGARGAPHAAACHFAEELVDAGRAHVPVGPDAAGGPA